MAVSPDGRLVVCTSETTSMVHVIDAATYQVIDNVLIDTRPRAAAFSPDGKEIWLTSELRGTATVIGADDRAVRGTIEFAVQGVPREQVQIGRASCRERVEIAV